MHYREKVIEDFKLQNCIKKVISNIDVRLLTDSNREEIIKYDLFKDLSNKIVNTHLKDVQTRIITHPLSMVKCKEYSLDLAIVSTDTMNDMIAEIYYLRSKLNNKGNPHISYDPYLCTSIKNENLITEDIKLAIINDNLEVAWVDEINSKAYKFINSYEDRGELIEKYKFIRWCGPADL